MGRMSDGICSCAVCSNSQNCTRLWGDLPVKGFVLFGCDTGKSRHHTKSSAHVLVHYQRSLKFYVHLYVPFAALRAEYCLVQAVLFSTFRIHSWEGISVLKILYTFGNVLRYGIQWLAGRHSCATAAARLFPSHKYEMCFNF